MDPSKAKTRGRADDAKAYMKPWTITVQFDVLPDTELIEQICDNEKDAAHLVGK